MVFELKHIPNTAEKSMSLEISSYLLFLYIILEITVWYRSIEKTPGHFLSYIQVSLKNLQVTLTVKALHVTKVNKSR